MAPRRLLTRWICVGILLPASIILFVFRLLQPWNIPKNLDISPNILPSFPRISAFRLEGYQLAQQSKKDTSYALVLPVESGDDLAWIPPQLRKSDRFRIVSYVLNDRHSPNTVPSEKGGAVIAFISYIVQNYDNDGLADVNVFMRGKQLGAYNDDVLSNDASKMLARLRQEHVLKAGFVGLVCEVGDSNSADRERQAGCEELDLHDVESETAKIVSEAWGTLFPKKRRPQRLSVLSGGQFAASRSSIRKVPKSIWLDLEQYVINTNLSDSQILELFGALWRYIFTGRTDGCPDPQKCYCGLYAVCFTEFENYIKLKTQYKELEPVYDGILHAHHRIERARERQKDPFAAWFGSNKDRVEDGADPWNTEQAIEIRKRIGEVSQSMWRLKNQAWRRGDELHHPS